VQETNLAWKNIPLMKLRNSSSAHLTFIFNKTKKFKIFFAVLLLLMAYILPVFAETLKNFEKGPMKKENGMERLLIVGPGGPYEAMKEAADAFTRLKGVAVEVIKGPPENWFEQQADLIYGGAPNMLEDFIAEHPNALEPGSIRQLYKRQIGIIVHKGNPKRIAELADLGRDPIKLLDVKLETMGEFQNKVPNLAEHIYLLVTTGNQGIQAWRSMPELDAWITYKSWHLVLSRETDFIPLTSVSGSLRTTPIAITAWTKKKNLAQAFILFLKSEAGHIIFQRRGWE
jgi:accessory colonization factor AcfC